MPRARVDLSRRLLLYGDFKLRIDPRKDRIGDGVMSMLMLGLGDPPEVVLSPSREKRSPRASEMQ